MLTLIHTSSSLLDRRGKLGIETARQAIGERRYSACKILLPSICQESHCWNKRSWLSPQRPNCICRKRGFVRYVTEEKGLVNQQCTGITFARLSSSIPAYRLHPEQLSTDRTHDDISIMAAMNELPSEIILHIAQCMSKLPLHP
jgi:hypothetical protein